MVESKNNNKKLTTGFPAGKMFGTLKRGYLNKNEIVLALKTIVSINILKQMVQNHGL